MNSLATPDTTNRRESNFEDLSDDLPSLGLPYTPRILLAEDSTETQVILAHLFERLGVEIDIVDDGERCLEQALWAMKDGQPYDVVLVDIYMPGITGHEVARKLREQGFEGPLIAITASPSLGTRCTCIHSGFDHFLAKSSLAHTIVPALKIYLDG